MARRLTIERTAVAMLFAIVAVIGVRPRVDADLWWHLAAGRWMVDHHAVIGGDPFSWTAAGMTRVPADWLGQVVFWGVWSAGGLTAMVLFVAALAVAGMVATYCACTGPTLLKVAVIALATTAASVFWSARPQMFTFVFTALTLLIVRRWSTDPDRRSIWWLVPLVVVWSNTHAGVVYGLIVIVASAVGRLADDVVAARRPSPEGASAGAGEDQPRRLDAAARGRLLAVTGACLLAPIASAGGIALYALPFRHYELNALVIEEFQPPSLADPAMWPFFVLLTLALAAIGSGIRARDTRVADVLLVLVVGALALRFTRAVSFFAVVAAPVVCEQATRWVELRREDRAAGRAGGAEPAIRPAVLGVALAATVVIAIGGGVARLDQARTDVEESFPVGAQRWLATNRPPGHLFNPFSWGGYLELHDPSMPVSIDSRNDLYGERLAWYAQVATVSGDWAGALDRDQVNTVLVPTGSALDLALTGRAGWHRGHQDAVATVHVRDTPIPGG